MKYLFAILILSQFTINMVFAQSTKQEMFDIPEKTGGVYYAYPSKDIIPQTDPLKGYKPFYISHFGRHGSRYLIGDNDYKWVLDVLKSASEQKALTPLGIGVYERLIKVWAEAEGHGGDLSPLGVRQQRGIAERMYKNYPEVFKDSVKISARSTIVVRCILTMDAFCERLKEFNPTLQVNRESSNKYMKYLNFHTKEAVAFRSEKDTWKKNLESFQQEHVKPNRLVASLFTDSAFVNKQVNKESLMWGFYWIASDMQDMETKVSFYDLFEKQELFDLWQCINAGEYINNANNSFNGKIMLGNAKPVLDNIITTANDLIAASKNGATFRFAHDGNMMPLLAILNLEGCNGDTDSIANIYKVWSNYKIAPMAGNVQMIFYRKPKSDDVIVKFLLNEIEKTIPDLKSDILPYYHWKDVESYYKNILNR